MLHDLHMCPLQGKKMLFEINWDYRPTEVRQQHPLRCPPHHGVASIIWRKRWKKTRQTRRISPQPTGETSWALTCPGDWPHPSQYWWDSRVPAGYWWWGCGASSCRNRRCPESASLRYLHGNSTGRGFKKVVLIPHMQAVAHHWHENSPVSRDTAGNAQSHGRSFSWWQSIRWRLGFESLVLCVTLLAYRDDEPLLNLTEIQEIMTSKSHRWHPKCVSILAVY